MQGAGSVPFLYREGDREMQLSEPDSRVGLPIEPNVFGLIRISRRVRFLGTIDAAPESISNYLQNRQMKVSVGTVKKSIAAMASR